MATSGLVFWRFAIVVYVTSFLFTSNLKLVDAVPIAASTVAKQSLDIKNQTTVASPGLINSLVASDHSGSSKSTITTEKLKRGLSNFMNQLDAAPFFVPVNLHQTTRNNNGRLSLFSPYADKGNAHKTSEISNNIEEMPSTMIKSTNRPLVQIWANGGPGRWGR